MLLDNLFSIVGETGTALILFAILGFVASPAVSSVVCPAHTLRRLQPRGR